MDEMAALAKSSSTPPGEILFVNADASGKPARTAVNSARAFNDLLNITGSILTKMARRRLRATAQPSPSATSPEHPIKFLGTFGEQQLTPSKPFHPDLHRQAAINGPRRHRHPPRARPNPPSTAAKPSSSPRKALSGDGFLPRRLPRAAPSDRRKMEQA